MLSRIGAKVFILLLLLIIGAVLITRFWSSSPDTGMDTTPDVVHDIRNAPESHFDTEAIVSAHPLATEAGLEILDKGGTAADAAVAVAAVLSIVEPHFSSPLGGGTWALYYSKETGEVTSLDGVGPVGILATIDDYSSRNGVSGPHQAIVPGAWDGWMLWLQEYGRLDLEEVLSPAIRIAREGHPLSVSTENWLNQLSQEVLSWPYARAIYVREGRVLQAGETVYQRDMADTYEALSNVYEKERGNGRIAALQAARDYYYRGPVAQRLVEFSDEFDGYLTIADFNGFEAEIVESIHIDYNEEIRVLGNPPNSQGIAMLLALNILKDYDYSALGPNHPDLIHRQVEALKLSFADRYFYIGDPERMTVSVEKLLSDEYAQSRRERIDMNRAMKWPIDPGLGKVPNSSHTTTFHIRDREGNAAAVTTSLGAGFMVAGDTGIHINNRMQMLSLEQDLPNQLTPGYKVRHTSNPYMVFRNGNPYILGGNTGVDTQPQAQLQQFMSVVEFGLSPQEAVDRPRFVSTAHPAGYYPYQTGNRLQMESGFSEEVLSVLRSRGHEIVIDRGIFGSANMLVIDEDTNTIQLGAESRDDSFGRIRTNNSD